MISARKKRKKKNKRNSKLIDSMIARSMREKKSLFPLLAFSPPAKDLSQLHETLLEAGLTKAHGMRQFRVREGGG